MENRIKLAIRLDNISVVITGIYLLLFPVIITTLTTDAYLIPKQIGIGLVILTGLVLFAARGIVAGNVRLRRTPFDLPLILFLIAALLSAIFAVNRFDSLITFVPFMFTILLFFLITNTAKKKRDFMFLTYSLIIGGVLVSAITLLSYLQIYPLPFAFAKVQTFTPLGALFDQLIYLIMLLSLALYLAVPALKRKIEDRSKLVYIIGAFLLILGTVITAVAVFSLQRPTILPFQTGFQTALSSISQDTGRVLQGFLMGSGIGTFITDFTRFKPASFNLNETLWNLSFLRSSTWVLEILATMGLLGILSFLYLVYKVIRTKPLFPPIIVAVVLAFLIPFSYSSIMLFFVILAIYSVREGISERNKNLFFDVDLKIVALKRGMLALSDPTGTHKESDHSNILPWFVAILLGVFVFVIGMVSIRYATSDILFQRALVAASRNDAQNTYQYMTDGIRMFPQRDGYHRIFSQINLSIANNLASSIPEGTQPTPEQQQTIFQLIQQAINSGRQATAVSPQNAINWQNLSSIYRALIGFGQNADQFALLTNQQAIVLDPNNPQQYISYGGIYYQLGQWDNAIRQFEIAANLKPDFANAFYNLGHALQEKGDLQGAIDQFLRVKALVGNDQNSLDIINREIEALQTRIGQTQSAQPNAQAAENQPPLEVNQPAAQLPEQEPPVEIPGPTTSVTPSPSPSPAPAP
jgi:tetratricopeptide (TPR) repeat protein